MYTAQSTEVVALDPLIAAELAKLIDRIHMETGLNVTMKDVVRMACWEVIHNWDATQPITFE